MKHHDILPLPEARAMVVGSMVGVRGRSIAVICAGLALTGLLALIVTSSRPEQRRLGAYAVSLGERTPHQRHNALLAASKLNGVVLQPGATLSFNAVLGGWTAAQGYLKAPVSYDGVLIDDFGGGVCETSTVLYNAALLAGLTVTERHAHTFAPSYVELGRDAAVAYSNIDLKIRNPYREPVTIRFNSVNNEMTCSVVGNVGVVPAVRITSWVLDRLSAPISPLRADYTARTARWNVHGRNGFRVAVYSERVGHFGTGIDRRLLSDNTYQPLAGIR